MERKLENELPVKGKKYKRITGDSAVYNKGYTYICKEDYKLKNMVWFDKNNFSKLFVEVIEEDKTTERKLEKGELPVKGKKYRFIGETDSYYSKDQTYFCEENKVLTSDILGEVFTWYEDFSEKFVEVVEESKSNPVKYEDSWYKKMEEEVNAERGYNRTLLKPLSMEEVKFLSNLEEENERKLMFPEPTVGVKHDQNKLPLYTIIFKQFPLAIQAVAKRALAGHNKYIETDADWQNFARAGEQDPDRYKNAGLRHMLEEGEDKEEGMEGTTHEAAVVWNFLADLECKLRIENGENI